MPGLPITNYTVWQIKKYTNVVVVSSFIILVLINILTAIFVDSVKVCPDDYIIKKGFPFFTTQEAYIKLVKSYPHDFGTKINIYKTRRDESYWDIAIRNNISVDTLIAANPFLDTLLAKENTEIVIPGDTGVLIAIDNAFDVWRMKNILKYSGKIKGDFFPSVFRILNPDQIKFAFFKNAKPEIVNDSLERLFALKREFQSPVKGRYTSMYGQRVDPFIHGMSFHNGIDIKGKTGEPIYPAKEGMVSFVGWQGNMGLCIRILHHNGYETTYGHCINASVTSGEWVTKKDIIGHIGSTGRSTGSHLHFTIKRHGQLINPLLLIW